LLAKYKAMQAALKPLEEALTVRNEASCLLPGLLLGNRTKVTDEIKEAVRLTRKLQKELAKGPPWAGGQAEVVLLTDDVAARLGRRQKLNSLQPLMGRTASGAFQGPIAGMKKGNLADIQQGQALLLTACPATRDRLAIWSAFREGSRACG